MNKTIRTILLILAAIAIIGVFSKAKAAEPRFSVSPYAAIKTANIDGQSTLGSGLDAGFKLNPFVSIHAAATAYDADGWRGSAVDEGEAYAKARLASFADEALSFYVKAGTVYEFNEREWGIAPGAGVELRLSKNVSLAGDYTVRAYWNGKEKDSLVRGLVSFRF